MKIFFDNNLQCGFVYRYKKEQSLPKKLLKGKKARIFCNCYGPGFFLLIFSFLSGIHLKTYFKTSILGFCGIKLEEFNLFSSIIKKSEQELEKILNKIEK